MFLIRCLNIWYIELGFQYIHVNVQLTLLSFHCRYNTFPCLTKRIFPCSDLFFHSTSFNISGKCRLLTIEVPQERNPVLYNSSIRNVEVKKLSKYTLWKESNLNSYTCTCTMYIYKQHWVWLAAPKLNTWRLLTMKIFYSVSTFSN